ncbi:glutathione S-transferase protein-like protein [Eremomyces bilateralis CBS 781.70]|uniref:Glutathione S-transferase protein-like protein n=1 Tax=Eremomyces bilateralis CBS 781.70 TaxID=1392243 RepID=A0A6G1GEC5_9PEZI|nr:glutathione S-transferase protein-like protein [Eremomyces bilateralis CBS 781.70]KAF1816408.1 glutathione S-transferase protein-like protein [Eremomyces bilateralis CBS 781.70]
MSESKRQKLSSGSSHTPIYHLIYWPDIPGRGEFVRLAFEAAGTAYLDVSNASSAGVKPVLSLISDKHVGDDVGNPPIFAPPALKIVDGKGEGKDLLIHQTPNILAYLGERLGLIGEEEGDKYHVSQVALTALDLCDECHDTHHPVSVVKYYAEQKEEALKKAEDFRASRIPKFFGYFERVLKSNESEAKGKYLVGSKLTYADTTVWQVVNGVSYAFPKEVEARKKDYPLLFETFYPGIQEEKGIKQYLASDRRLSYSDGIFRHYPELDQQ